MIWLLVLVLLGTPTQRDQQFAKTVRPILEHRCQPCHFTGGKMYTRLPFDRADTIVKLGTTKLFTRIKDERDRDVIRKYLAAK